MFSVLIKLIAWANSSSDASLILIVRISSAQAADNTIEHISISATNNCKIVKTGITDNALDCSRFFDVFVISGSLYCLYL